MHDLGDTITIAARCVNAAGTLANCTTVALTVTRPDGTTETPAVANPPAVTGEYTVAYVAAAAGRHTWRMTFTGAVPDQVYGDVFNVWALTDLAIIGLAEAKDHLNIGASDITHDSELRRAIRGASAVVESIVGACARRTVAETFSGRGGTRVYLGLSPVLSVTSIVADGAALAASTYSLNPSRGVLTRTGGGVWPVGDNNIAVTYVPGRTVIADNILDGCRDLVRANFRPQLGGNRSPFDTAPAAAPAAGGEMRLGFFVPHSVMERLTPDQQGPFYM